MWIHNWVWIILAISTWSYLFPEEALALIAELKRQIRLRLIHRAGAEGAKELAQSLQAWSKQQYIDPRLVEQVMAERYESIVERVGTPIADQILGEPDPTERDY